MVVAELEFFEAALYKVRDMLEFEFYQDVGEVLFALLFWKRGVAGKGMGCLVDHCVLGGLFHVFNVDMRLMAAVRFFHGKEKAVKLFKG
jgi:hypothetical protein